MRTMAKQRPISFRVNVAEFLALEYRARAANLSVPAYVRTLAGLETWRSRRHVFEQRSPGGAALDRLHVTIWVSGDEWSTLQERARAAEGLGLPGDRLGRGLGLPQYLRTLCGFRVRWNSKPGTHERHVEENDAWELLESIGLDPKEYFPEGSY